MHLYQSQKVWCTQTWTPQSFNLLISWQGIKKEPNKQWTPRTIMIGGKVCNLTSYSFKKSLSRFTSGIHMTLFISLSTSCRLLLDTTVPRWLSVWSQLLVKWSTTTLWLETVSKSSFWKTTESHWQRKVISKSLLYSEVFFLFFYLFFSFCSVHAVLFIF